MRPLRPPRARTGAGPEGPPSPARAFGTVRCDGRPGKAATVRPSEGPPRTRIRAIPRRRPRSALTARRAGGALRPLRHGRGRFPLERGQRWPARGSSSTIRVPWQKAWARGSGGLGRRLVRSPPRADIAGSCWRPGLPAHGGRGATQAVGRGSSRHAVAAACRRARGEAGPGTKALMESGAGAHGVMRAVAWSDHRRHAPAPERAVTRHLHPPTPRRPRRRSEPDPAGSVREARPSAGVACRLG